MSQITLSHTHAQHCQTQLCHTHTHTRCYIQHVGYCMSRNIIITHSCVTAHIYIYIHICTSTHVHTHTHTHTRTHTYAHTATLSHTHTDKQHWHTHTHTFEHAKLISVMPWFLCCPRLQHLHCVFFTHLPPPPSSFLTSTRHFLHLFRICWSKLTCGVIRSCDYYPHADVSI